MIINTKTAIAAIDSAAFIIFFIKQTITPIITPIINTIDPGGKDVRNSIIFIKLLIFYNNNK